MLKNLKQEKNNSVDKKMLKFHATSDEKFDVTKYDEDIQFMLEHGYHWEAGKLALVLGEVDAKYLYMVYDIGIKLFEKKEYSRAAAMFHSLVNFTDDLYTKKVVLEYTIKSYQKAIKVERDKYGESSPFHLPIR